MRSLRFLFPKQILSGSAVAVALLGLVGLTSPARADTTVVLCPNAAGTSGYGGDTFTDVSGGPTSCGANSAVTMYIPNQTTGYARLGGDLPDMTVGDLAGATANVTYAGSDQPFYMLTFTNPSDSLGQTLASDQILMLEFQPTALSGVGNDTLAFSPNTTLFNLYDNTQGFYLGQGQSYVKTLDGWFIAEPSIIGDTLQQIRI